MWKADELVTVCACVLLVIAMVGLVLAGWRLWMVCMHDIAGVGLMS